MAGAHGEDRKVLSATFKERLEGTPEGERTNTPPAETGRSPFRFAEVATAYPDRYLNIGQTVSISPMEPGLPLAATVAKISSDQIRLVLVRPTFKSSFKEGERVRIKYWDVQEAFYFESEILKVTGPTNEGVTISKPTEGVRVQRRKAQRVRKAIPFSLTVIKAADSDLVGEMEDAKTKDISVSGLRFETHLLLREGDRLEMDLHLNPSQQVNAVGWVVRFEPAESSGASLYSVAVEFLQLELEDQNQLLLFLAKTRPEDAEPFGA